MAVLRRQRAPQLFSSRPAGALRTLLLIAASIVLMVYDHQSSRLQKMHAALATIVWPVEAVVDAPHSFLFWANDKLATHTALVNENAALKNQLLQSSAQLQQYAALQQENMRLRALLEATGRLPGRVSEAQLLATDLDPFRHLVIIDKGSHDGVTLGQTVLDENGIVGQVTRADPLTAEVTLITDPGQAIQVEVNRTGLRTLAVGSAGLEQLALPYLTNAADVKPGDLLVSSGLGGHYPPGYPVGTIVKFDRNPAEPFATVSARTSADLSHGHNVLLYWSPPLPAAVPEPSKPAPVIAVPAKATRKKQP